MFKWFFLVSVTFFIIGLISLPHYGINWDTINHLPRGQAYLHFFLTGSKDYSDLPPLQKYWQRPESLFIDANVSKDAITKRSYYQNDSVTFETFMEIDGDGHPPLSDILSAFFNFVLFQKLQLINDIDAYRVYSILLSSILVGLIFGWVSRSYGYFAGLISTLSLSLYPLFFSELHFNSEKDIPETFYWTLFIYLFYLSITQRQIKWILLSGLAFGLALGTKLNIIFSALIIIPWMLIFAFANQLEFRKNKQFIYLLLIPILGFFIFFISWPYLWQDPIAGIGRVVHFYKNIGLTSNINTNFIGPLKINTYPLTWIVFTTPPLILFLSVIGIFKALSKVKLEKNKISLLFLLWLLVPIIRVSWPGATIYGGVRQIMEYIPALAIFAGLGAATLRNWRINNFLPKNIMTVVILLAFIPTILNIIRLHPNENVYFNSLTGGLSGAKQKQIPSWGNSFGAAYRQGIVWLNQHAEKNAEAVFAYELMPNMPLIWVRSDILFHNSKRSGPLRSGEYAMTLTYDGTDNRSYYDIYLQKMLEPVYQVTVDGVPILKIWKNDLAHTKDQYQKIETVPDITFRKVDNTLEIDLKRKIALSYIDSDYNSGNCKDVKQGKLSISEDGISWKTLSEGLPASQISVYNQQPKDNKFVYTFLGEKARLIKIEILPTNACLFNLNAVKVYYWPDIKK